MTLVNFLNCSGCCRKKFSELGSCERKLFVFISRLGDVNTGFFPYAGEEVGVLTERGNISKFVLSGLK